MAAKYWIKLYIEILDDPKMGRMSEALFARCMKIFLLAGDAEQDGGLPSVPDMAWRLRLDESQLEADLQALQALGIVELREGQWFVSHFVERQDAMAPAEKMRRRRADQHKQQYYPPDPVPQAATGDVTENTRVVTKSNAESEEESESESESEGEERGGYPPPPPAPPGAPVSSSLCPLPQTPLEASKHPDIQLFQRVSGVFPGQKDYRMVLDAATLLRQAHPDEGELESFLLAFWLRWQGLKRVNGEPVSKTNPTWFTEWAVQNYMPPERVKANKHPNKNGSKAALERVRASLKERNHDE